MRRGVAAHGGPALANPQAGAPKLVPPYGYASWSHFTLYGGRPGVETVCIPLPMNLE